MWEKLGWSFAAHGESEWMQSHAFVPTPFLRPDGTVRVYVAFLDADRLGRIGWVDVDPVDPVRPLRVSKKPVLDLGPPGSFDDSGVTPVQVVEWQGEVRLFYNGWQRSGRVPYHIFTGLAVSEDGGDSFRRVSPVPILERTATASLVRSTPFVLPPDARDFKWRAWYSAGSQAFVRADGRWAPQYGLSYAESDDGITWPSRDRPVFEANANEFGLTRAAVEADGEGYRMILSVRSHDEVYHLEEAVSPDGLDWHRTGRRPIVNSASGWDSEMVAFAGIVNTPKGRLMFFNGNGYGRAGFGVARYAEVA